MVQRRDRWARAPMGKAPARPVWVWQHASSYELARHVCVYGYAPELLSFYIHYPTCVHTRATQECCVMRVLYLCLSFGAVSVSHNNCQPAPAPRSTLYT
eukprot:scaffold5498_cov102-Isochrysis_galbana.AAC.2